MSALTTARSASYDRVADLPLRIDGYELSGLELAVSDAFTRLTTIVTLHGDGHRGVGEDTTYAPPDQLAFRAAGAVLPLAGAWTLDSFSAALAALELFPAPPSMAQFRPFRRWAFESAALDLALRQAGACLADVLDRTPGPVSFVVSPGPEDTADPVLARLARYPGMRLKLMPTPAWDDAVVDALAATEAVDVIDLKGQYDDRVPVALRPDAALYRRVVRAFGDAWIEDPGLTADTGPVLREHRDRVTWDAPIGGIEDIAALPWRPRMINVKPSRSGSLRRVLDVYDHCAQEGIGLYGGGQFELGPGRAQVQLLAALFHPDAPNDVAPAAFNDPVLADGLPASPLAAPERRVGFA